MLESEFDVFAVGMRHPHADALPMQEGFLMRAAPDGVFASGLFTGVSVQEAVALRDAEIKVGLFKYKDIIFVLTTIPGLSDGWIDMPFSMAIERKENQGLPQRDPGTALLMNFVLIDMPKKVIASLRAGTLSPVFWDVFEGMVAEQLEPERLIGKADYFQQVQEAYGKWSPGEMARRAVIMDTLGRPFQKDPQSYSPA